MRHLLPAALTLALLSTFPGAARSEDGAGPPQPRAESAPRYLIERIELEGLEQTSPSEVRRRLLVAPGEVLDEQRVLLSRLRLLQLGWFSRVESRVERGTVRGQVVLVFQVVERNTLVISDLFLGSTPAQPLYGGFGLTQQNFLGRGLGLSGAVVYGGAPAELPGAPHRFSLRGSFYDSDLALGDLPTLVAGITGLWVRGDELACADASCDDFNAHLGRAPRLRYERMGGEATLGIRPGPFDRLLGGLRLERVDGTFLPGTATAAQLGPSPSLRLGKSALFAFTGSYERDTRDDSFFPSGGSRFSAQVTFSSPAIGSDYDYGRYLLQAEKDLSLPRGHGLRLLAAAGAVQGDAPFFERFYAADWAYFSVGPALGRALELNFSTDSRYDALLLMGGGEYAVPLWRGDGFFQRGYLAIGARALYTSARSGAGRSRLSSTPFSGDLALRLDTPVGSFNLSAAYALDNFL
ncbi:MAG TPA: BamA/TamA family outer membrane protein [Anaeromyxobacteraceae bacterium]|nr:BamA/TamA family outer membrane protein [Anaeromyxobacteraceae bacterium]